MDYLFTMRHPICGTVAFTNKVELAEAYSRSGLIVTCKSNTGNGSKIYKPSKNYQC